MRKSFLTWLIIGITGILVVNMANIASSLYFGTLHAYPSFVLVSCFAYTIFLAIVTYRLYRKTKARPPVVKKLKKSKLQVRGDTVIYGRPPARGQSFDSLKLMSGEIRCGNCGFINGPNAKYCRNCRKKL